MLFILPTEAPVTADNMNYAIAPFAFIMGCSSLFFYFSARHWFTGPVRVIDGREVVLGDDDGDSIAPKSDPSSTENGSVHVDEKIM